VIGVQIACPKCKKVQEVDANSATCPDCRTVLRRCADCEHYDARVSQCAIFNRPVDMGDASYPTYSSDSTYCREYIPNERTRVVG
jgi:hypothetical protein